MNPEAGARPKHDGVETAPREPAPRDPAPREPAPREPAPTGRAADAAWLAPLVGAFLLVSPIAAAFPGAGAWLGVPATAWFLFGVWAALIAVAVAFSVRAARAEAATRQSPASQEAPPNGGSERDP